ncbi:hypothetical protein B0T25DRAFT_598154 [Lasiosphaeria hispida]|uniref:Uncharacterized protein n=1 Tax=Lasiosphaeria hispida TaxID=260671 RepID=A0AAJ0HX13_9PEZI|nr:hypothetical protein B0T25DRAFT_598154 [Lasiosphaeria hispida]
MGSELKATIPVLKGETNFKAWVSIIRFHLRLDGLEKYIDENVKKPADTEEATLTKWTRVSTKLGMDAGDPFETWKMVNRVIKHESDEGIGTYVEEYARLTRKSFDAMEAFIAKVHYLRTKIDSASTRGKGKVPDGFHITHIINCLKTAYPTDYMLWEKALAKDELSWAKLMDDLNGIIKKRARRHAIRIDGGQRRERKQGQQSIWQYSQQREYGQVRYVPLTTPIASSILAEASANAATSAQQRSQCPLMGGGSASYPIPSFYYSPNGPINLIETKSMKAAQLERSFRHNRILDRTTGKWIPCVEHEGVPIIPAKVNSSFDQSKHLIGQAVMALIHYKTMYRRLMHAYKDQVIRA